MRDVLNETAIRQELFFPTHFVQGSLLKQNTSLTKKNVSCNFLTLFYGTFHFFWYNPLFLNHNGPKKLFLMLLTFLLFSGLVSSVPSSLTFTSLTVSLPDGFLFAAASVLLGFPPFLCDQVVGAPITTQVFCFPSLLLSHSHNDSTLSPEPVTVEASFLTLQKI